MRAGPVFLIVITAAMFTACVRYETVEAPADIRLSALEEARYYIGMEYEYGGQDFYEKGIDCSGLVVNCYATAIRVYASKGATIGCGSCRYRVQKTNP